jgi:Ser/Thr protein kinase RdoA (MazF antagonist)
MNNAQVFIIADKFDLVGEPITVTECLTGHINSTYFVDCTSEAGLRRYVLQILNTNIFKKPDDVMRNILYVTKHIENKLIAAGLDSERGILHVVYTKNGEYAYIDKEGRYWRAYRFVEDATCYQAVESAEMFTKVGLAFGNFQKQLSDFDASLLAETIPNFHNTEDRLRQLTDAMENDAAGRLKSVSEEIKFVMERKPACSYINERIADGRLPLRVTHNDTKLNNIMMDNETGEGICVIDLDTVMPGSVLADFGDSIRFGASSAAEDETDLDKVYVRLDMFDAFAKGFIEGLDHSLSEQEILSLPMGAYILTLETGIRFLTDYLNGDTYFRTAYAQHNLDRARNQFKLVADMEEKMSQMDQIIRKYL